MAYTNSPLVEHTRLSPNYTKGRRGINRITPHCVVGQTSIEALGVYFAKNTTRASSNYGIGKDGKIGLFVEEKNTSWCSSNSGNDTWGVTIECASDAFYPYKFNDVVYQKLITLSIDICQRNGKKKLLWLETKERTFDYLAKGIKDDEAVITLHRWYDYKACPGDWLVGKLADYANRVTAALALVQPQVGQEPVPAPPATTPTGGFFVALPTLKRGAYGDYGESVRAMQILLIGRGFSCGRWGADGSFGGATLQALRGFQRAAGLTVDGVCGTNTWRRLLGV